MRVFLANLYFFFAFFPFLSPLPVDSDLQPTSVIVGIITFIFFMLTNKGKVKSDKVDYLFLVLLLLFFFIAVFNFNAYSLKYFIVFLFCFFNFYFVKYFFKYLSIATIIFCSFVYFLGAAFQYLFPDIFSSIFSHFMRAIKYKVEGGRGLTSFAPEPSFFSFVCVLLFYHVIYFFKLKQLGKCAASIVGVTLIALVLSSKSLTGLILLLPLVGFFKLRVNIFIAIFVALLIVASFSVGPSSRINSFMSKVFKEPEYILRDASVVSRLSQIAIGFCSPWVHPLGMPGVEFSVSAYTVYNKCHVSDLSSDKVADERVLYEIQNGRPNSSFVVMSLQYGFLYLLFSIVILCSLFSGKMKIIILLPLYAFFTSFSIGSPFFWLAYSVVKKIKRIDCEKR